MLVTFSFGSITIFPQETPKYDERDSNSLSIVPHEKFRVLSALDFSFPKRNSRGSFRYGKPTGSKF